MHKKPGCVFIEWNDTKIPVENTNEALLHESEIGNLTRVQFMLNHCTGADINAAENVTGYTPLIYASRYGYSNVLQLILEHEDIDINKANNDGNTALYWASYYGHFMIVQMLLKHEGIETG